jgi:flagellar assembly factor FliW
MPKLSTVYFQELEYSNESIFSFPGGIPGFEDQIAFLFVEQPATRPLVYMQSLLNGRLCFLVVPVLMVEPEYRLSLSPEELVTLGLAPDKTPEIGTDVGCFVLLTVSEDAPPTVNLMSPVVLNLKSRKGLQAIPTTSQYSLRHTLALEKETAPCS